MPDSKITALTSISTSTDPANDPLVIVDLSDTSMAASGTTKKVTLNQLLGASGTATLASATITGAATVGTTLGVTGVSTFAAGTALLPALTTTGDTNTGIYYPAADTFAVTTGGTERYRVDSTGNVGIGVTPSEWQSPFKAIELQAGSLAANNTASLRLIQNAVFNSSAWLYKTTAPASRYEQDSGGHYWLIAPSGTAGNAITFTQAMTLDASGRLLVNTASVIGGSGDTLQIAGKTIAGTDYCSMYTGTSTTVYGARYYHTSAVVGSITFTASGTAYNIASDYRLKEAVAPLTGGLARVSALKPSIYKWKVNGSDGEGFIAHELAEVIPAAVTGQKDAVNEDGSIQPQQVDLSKIVPVLVAAIQELTAEVNALKNA